MAKMREIVDKHFYDNWVLPVYMGYIADLSFWWTSYKASRDALNNTLIQSNLKHCIKTYIRKLSKFNKKASELLLEGVLTEEFCLHNVSKLVDVIRECNVTVRWLML